MKADWDDRTLDMMPPPEPPKRGKGKPVGDMPPKSAKERQAARRLRLKMQQRGFLTVEVSYGILAKLDELYPEGTKGKSEFVESVLRKVLFPVTVAE